MGQRILVAVIFVPILLVIMLLLPPIAWTGVVMFISAVAAFELLRAAGERRVSPPMQAASILSAAALPLCCWAGVWAPAAGVCAFGVMAVSFWCAIRAYDEGGVPIGFFQVLLTLFAGVMVPMGLSALVALKCMDQGEYLVLLAVLLAFVTDAGAYFAGVFLGRHRGVTRVSPNKSLEGYLGGFLTGLAFSLGYGAVISAVSDQGVNYLSLALCGLFGALATELGDLAFSFIKRQYGVKDYGHLLPGHGGMLDRFDSMIFCGPVVLFLILRLPVF
ncbi:MAG TPA: phosphatidate cytidylyltransferase [Firmicutes bacterium]|nr:phosphatidate cytidylyltransferase [Bacillota bacterium]